MRPLASDVVLRGLRYLAVVNASDVFPTGDQVDAFVYTEVPRVPTDLFETATTSVSLAAFLSQFDRKSVAEYLMTTGMAAEHGGGLRLTKVGRAFEIGVERHSSQGIHAEGKLEVVGRLEDPIVYAKLLTEIDKLSNSLVVDPYLPPADLFALLELPNVTRVLTKDASIKGQNEGDRRRHLAIALGSRPEMAVRFLPTRMRELHDRLVLPGGDQGGLSIGTSLGGSQVTVITHLGIESTQVLRAHYDALWDQAVPLEPIARIGQGDESATAHRAIE